MHYHVKNRGSCDSNPRPVESESEFAIHYTIELGRYRFFRSVSVSFFFGFTFKSVFDFGFHENLCFGFGFGFSFCDRCGSKA